ncbi:MAG: DinB family protein [Anaerolineae bacterium]
MSLQDCISYITFAREELLRQIEGLSEESLANTPVVVEPPPGGPTAAAGDEGRPGWYLTQDIAEIFKTRDMTVKDILAHIAAWEVRMAEIVPLMLADRADEIPAVEVAVFTRKAIAERRTRSCAEILVELDVARSTLLEILTAAGDMAVAKRRTRGGRTFTIQSYLVDVMAEHDRIHAQQIQLWREANGL